MPTPIFPLAQIRVGRYNCFGIMKDNSLDLHNILRWPHGFIAVGPSNLEGELLKGLYPGNTNINRLARSGYPIICKCCPGSAVGFDVPFTYLNRGQTEGTYDIADVRMPYYERRGFLGRSPDYRISQYPRPKV